MCRRNGLVAKLGSSGRSGPPQSVSSLQERGSVYSYGLPCDIPSWQYIAWYLPKNSLLYIFTFTHSLPFLSIFDFSLFLVSTTTPTEKAETPKFPWIAIGLSHRGKSRTSLLRASSLSFTKDMF